ncbi:MAG: hypothetical protein ACJAVV_000861 [Alphaproteobacteria bacterium]|jgi:hypothetical protein
MSLAVFFMATLLNFNTSAKAAATEVNISVVGNFNLRLDLKKKVN